MKHKIKKIIETELKNGIYIPKNLITNNLHKKDKKRFDPLAFIWAIISTIIVVLILRNIV